MYFQENNFILSILFREFNNSFMTATTVLVELNDNGGITVKTKSSIICPPRAINKAEGEKACREIVKRIKQKYPEIMINNVGFDLGGFNV